MNDNSLIRYIFQLTNLSIKNKLKKYNFNKIPLKNIEGQLCDNIHIPINKLSSKTKFKKYSFNNIHIPINKHEYQN